MFKIIIKFDNDASSIKNSIDIKSEDLKFMKETAEQEDINKYKTLFSPEFKVTFGDVKETADAGKIIEYLKERLAEELAASF